MCGRFQVESSTMAFGLRTSAMWRSATATTSKSSTRTRVWRAIASHWAVVRCPFFSLLESSLYYGQETERNRISVPLSASAWTVFSFSSTIVYQVFLPVFTDPTDIDLCLRQLIVHLPYLRSLGVTALQLFPIEQYQCTSPQTFCWRTVSLPLSPREHEHPIPGRAAHSIRDINTSAGRGVAGARGRSCSIPGGGLVALRRSLAGLRRQPPGPARPLSPRRGTFSARCPLSRPMGAFRSRGTRRATRPPQMAGRGGSGRCRMDRHRMHDCRGNALQTGIRRQGPRGGTVSPGVGGNRGNPRDRRSEIPADGGSVSRGV